MSATVYERRSGAALRVIAARLPPAAAGVIASFLVCCAFYRAFDATLTSLGWAYWAPWTATWWAGILVPLALLALISVGILSAITITLRRARFSHGVGPFLIGYGGLLAAWWVQNLVSIWTSCGSDPSFMGTATATPGSCFVAFSGGVPEFRSAGTSKGVWPPRNHRTYQVVRAGFAVTLSDNQAERWRRP